MPSMILIRIINHTEGDGQYEYCIQASEPRQRGHIIFGVNQRFIREEAFEAKEAVVDEAPDHREDSGGAHDGRQGRLLKVIDQEAAYDEAESCPTSPNMMPKMKE